MAEKNVVRQDVVQFIWESDMASIRAITTQMDNLTDGIGEVSKNFQSVNGSADLAGSAMKGVVKQGRNIEEIETGQLAKDFQDLTRNANKSEKAVKKVAAAGRKIDNMGVDSAAKDFLKLEGSVDKAGKSIKVLDKLKLSGLTKGLDAVKSKLESISDKAGKIKDKLKDAGAGILGAAGIGLGVGAAVSTSIDYQQSYNKLQAQTGASDKEMQSLGGTVRELYSDNMGESFEDLVNSVAQVRNITGASGKALKQMTNDALLLRDTFEFDVNESVRSADMMMRQFGISGEQAYSLIIQGAQNGLDKNGDLLDTLNEYSVHFRQMGFSGAEMVNMLVSGAKSGTFSVDKLGDAVKEFNIRAKDGSKSTLEAFTALGLNATKIADDFAHGGTAGKKAFQEVTKKIAAMRDPLQQDAIGIALFGTMWEDLQAEGVLALSNLNSKISSTTDALESVNAVRYQDLGSALSALGRSFQTEVILPLTTGLTNDFSMAVEQVKGYIKDFGAGLRGEGAAIGTVWGQVGLLFRTVGGVIGNVLGFAARHANILVPAILGIVAAMTVWKVVSTAVAAVEKVRTVIETIAAGKTMFAAAAQWVMNTAMYACPALWLVGAIIAVIAVIALLVWWVSKLINKFTGANDTMSDFGNGIDSVGNNLDSLSNKEINMSMGLKGDPVGDLNQQFQAQPLDVDANVTPGWSDKSLAWPDESLAFDAPAAQVETNKFADYSGFNDSVTPAGYMEQTIPTADSNLQLGGYTPEAAPTNISNNSTSQEKTINYAPVIQVTVNGTDNDAKTEEKTRVQVKKILREEFESFRRKHVRSIEA